MLSQGFPCGSAGKESTCNVGVLGLIPGLGRSPGEGKGYPLQYSGLEKSMNCIVHGVTKSWTRLSDFHFTSPALQADSLPSESPGKTKNTGAGSLSLLQWIFLTQESNWALLHCRRILYQLSCQESPVNS